MPKIFSRRIFASALFALAFPLLDIAPVHAASPAETFISDDIQKGLAILNDPQLPGPQRASQFEGLLLGMTDMRRVAMFSLGQYAQSASQADRDAFAAAFQDYSIAVYRSYLGKYSGQTLKVTGSSERAPDDFVVTTNMFDTRDHAGRSPLEVDFRVRTDSGKPILTDLSVSGVWLALAERDAFAAFLSQNHGDIPALVDHLHKITAQYS